MKNRCRFELLRAQRVRLRLRRQLDGADIDLQAYGNSHADFRAGLPMAQRLSQIERRIRPDMAIMLLVDVSGSNNGWIAKMVRPRPGALGRIPALLCERGAQERRVVEPNTFSRTKRSRDAGVFGP